MIRRFKNYVKYSTPVSLRTKRVIVKLRTEPNQIPRIETEMSLRRQLFNVVTVVTVTAGEVFSDDVCLHICAVSRLCLMKLKFCTEYDNHIRFLYAKSLSKFISSRPQHCRWFGTGLAPRRQQQFPPCRLGSTGLLDNIGFGSGLVLSGLVLSGTKPLTRFSVHQILWPLGFKRLWKLNRSR